MDTAIKENRSFQAIGESFANRLPSQKVRLFELYDFEDKDLNRAWKVESQAFEWD